MAKFTQEALDKIKLDPDLFAAVCKAMGVRPTSLPEIIKRNGNNLNQYSIVTLVASHLGVEPEEVLESESEESKTSITVD